jgi:hypothetical protein
VREAVPLSSDEAVQHVWARRHRYDRVAQRARAQLDRLRRANLVLLTLGALLGAVAAQGALPRWLTAAAGAAGAGALVLAGIVQRRATSGIAATWTTARGASETVKAAVFEYLVRIPPFDGPDRDGELLRLSRRIADRVRALDVELGEVDDEPEAVPAISGLDDYVRLRAADQADWHRRKVDDHRGSARRLRALELAATLLGAALTGLAALLDSADLGVWIGVATTVGSAVAAHIDAARHDQIAATYATTARRLDDLLVRLRTEDAIDEARFVRDVEDVLERQNDTWVGILGGVAADVT